MMNLEHMLEKIIFAGRWLLAPLYIGLLAALLPILYRFGHSFWHIMTHITTLSMSEITLQVLELLDTVLLGNLIILVLFAGYENFVSKIAIADGAEDRPHWMGHVDSSGMKIKLIGSLVAISVIELLKDFMQDGPFDPKREGWRIGIHMTFVVSGLLFALMDTIADRHKSER
jgi:uncharacterized protein (TIGR00645 family)